MNPNSPGLKYLLESADELRACSMVVAEIAEILRDHMSERNIHSRVIGLALKGCRFNFKAAQRDIVHAAELIGISEDDLKREVRVRMGLGPEGCVEAASAGVSDDNAETEGEYDA